jgi:hypothetical protein
MSEPKYTMFEPMKDRDLLTKKYPELGRMDEFNRLLQHEQEFVWLYACELSPFVKKIPDRHERARKSFEVSRRNKEYQNDEYQNYCSLIFPDHIKTAVERMAKFRSDLRSRALAALENAYNSCIEVLDAPIPGKIHEFDDQEQEFVYKDVTPAMIKQVIEAKQKAREELPGIIKQIEEGFGIIMVKQDEQDNSAIRQFIQQKKLT